ncbi:class I SAM-dependent methyltransferase [Flavihumibacter sp. R14]|nr:class I SAM-dependent methyltransferase [Flavihumibacter soli]
MNIACPICDSIESTQDFIVNTGEQTYTVEICSKCSHHYTQFAFAVDPQLLYNDEVYQVIDNRDSVYSRIMDYEYGNVLKYLGSLYPDGSRLLDFGSGKGIFLNLAKKAGFKTLGVETAVVRAEFAREKYALNILNTMYESGPLDKDRFEVITLFHVLEHLPKPKELVQNLIGDNLKPQGMLILEVPNLSAWQSRIAGNSWMHLDIPRHLSHFTRKRMAEFCSELDLQIVRTETFSWHLGVLGMCHSILNLFGYKGKIIKDLKHYNKKVMLALIPVLPFALVAEVLASILGCGGVIRVYCRRV